MNLPRQADAADQTLIVAGFLRGILVKPGAGKAPSSAIRFLTRTGGRAQFDGAPD